jgi:hypothetical protein
MSNSMEKMITDTNYHNDSHNHMMSADVENRNNDQSANQKSVSILGKDEFDKDLNDFLLDDKSQQNMLGQLSDNGVMLPQKSIDTPKHMNTA